MKQSFGLFVLALVINVTVTSAIRQQPQKDVSPTLPKTDYCLPCLLFVNLLDDWIDSSGSQSELESLVTKFCTRLNMNKIDESVCSGLAHEMGPTLLPILTSIELSGPTICAKLGYCAPITSNSTYRVALPPKPVKPIQPILKNTDVVGTYIQLSDIHWDDMYAVGSPTECSTPLCCRINSKNPDVISGNRTAKTWGEYSCDIPIVSVVAALQAVRNAKPDFVIVTGDLTPHDIWNQTQAQQLHRLQKLSEIMQEFLPDVPVFPAIGNHDTYPVDQFNVKPKDNAHHDDFQWLLEGLKQSWKPWLNYKIDSLNKNENALDTFRERGYYTLLLKPGLRLMALNTQWGDTWNWYMLLEENQQMPQFEWMVQVLSAAEQNGEKVIIIGHIPSNQAEPEQVAIYPTEYIKIVNRFEDVIVGQLFGHTHDDEFNIIYQNGTSSVPSEIVYISSSVTTFGNHNPSYRVYKYNSDFEIVDYDHYIANITVANTNNSRLTFQKEYSALSEYGLSDMSPASWNNLVAEFQTDDSLFMKWFANFRTRTEADKPCDASCKKSLLCRMTQITAFWC